MTEYRYAGGHSRQWPFEAHPERDGFLSAEPDEVIEFGDREPPNDGSWQVRDAGGNWTYWAPEPAEEEAVPAAPEITPPASPGTGASDEAPPSEDASTE